MRKTTYLLIALLISSFSWQINAQTTYNLDWYTDISSEDASLIIDAGDTVIWTFTDGAPHSVTSDTGSNETFDSGTLDAGSTYQYTFTEAGVNDYHCEVHPSMVGTITVNAFTESNQVQLGDGNNQSQNLPFEPFYEYSYTQSIYLSSEINASGEITGLQWYFSGTSALPDSQNLVIYVAHTSEVSYDSNTDWIPISEFTQVYSGGIDVSGGEGWTTITFDTPFMYNGTDNLVIAVDESMSGYDSSADDFYNTDVGTQRSIGFYSDSTNPDPTAPPTTGSYLFSSNFVPNIILDGIAPTCPYPSEISVTDISAFSADLFWTAGGDETEWEIVYGEEGFDIETEGVTISDNDGIIGESLTNLSSDTEYEVYIKSICSTSDESTFTGPISFATLISCPAPTEIYTSNVTPTSAEVYWMAGSDETEWEVIYGEAGFDPDTEGMIMADDDGTLGVELTGLAPQTQYDVYVKAVCGVDDESEWVGPYTFGDYTALEVTGGYNEDVIANGIGDPQTTTTALVDNDSFAYLSVDYQFSATDSPAGFGLPLDGNLSEGPTAGLNYQLEDYSTNNVLRMDTAGEANGGTITFNNTQTASNLYIAATSGSGTSVLAGTITFDDNTTQDIPNTNVSDWYGGPDNVTIISGLGRVNVTDGNTESSSTNPRIYQLTISIDPSNYGKVITSVDLHKESGNGVINVFGASIQFAPDCAEPTDVLVENITSDSADITWTAGNTETEWEVLFGEAGFDPEIEGTMMSDNDGEIGVSISGLSASTAYDVYVRAICGEGNESIWVLESFFTLPSNDECDNAIELVVNEDLECTNTTPGATVGATASDLGDDEDVTGTPNNDVWFTFTATSASHPISLSNIEAIIGTSTDMAMALYDGTEGCEILTLVDDSDPNSFTATGLTVGNTYYLRVYGYSANNSAQTSFDVCIQTIQCPVPMELSIGGFTTSSADVTWVAGGSETEWEILYGEEGFDTETDGILVSDSDGIIGETISELSDNTTYEVYLRAVCGDDSESELVGPVSFTTLPEPVIVTSENPVMNETYCYTDNEFNQWLFEAENGETLQISFNAGTLEEFYDWWTGNTFTYDDLIIYDGQDDTGEVLFNSDEDGYELEGLSFDALSGYIFMTLDSDVSGSCDTASEVPFDFDVYILSCLEPTEVIVENITSNTAELTWVSNGEESEWEILYGEIGFDPETEGISVIDNDGELDYLLENLNSNAEYEVYVRAICAEDDLSQWSDSAMFTTDCDIYIPYYLESFDEFLPACWEEAGSGLPSEGPSEFGTGSWFDDEFLNTGTNMAATINLYTTGREEWLISPSFDLSGNTYELTYQVATSVYTNSDPSNMGSDDEVQLLISEDNGVTWQNLMTYNTDNAPGAEATSQTIDLSSYSGTVKFAFWATDGEVNDDEDYDFFIDDFEITETLSVSNSNFIGFNYYPNPVKTNLHLEATKSSIETVTVYDLLGKKVFTQKYNTLSADLNLSNLESGSYVVVVNINNQSKTIRFIKE